MKQLIKSQQPVTVCSEEVRIKGQTYVNVIMPAKQGHGTSVQRVNVKSLEDME